MRTKDLSVPEPCTADWDRMRASGTRRHCGTCDKHVHDLSAMTEKAAAALVQSTPSLCVRYTSNASGEVLFKRPRQRLFPLRLARPLAMTGVLLAGCVEPSPDGALEGDAMVWEDGGVEYPPAYDDDDAGSDGDWSARGWEDTFATGGDAVVIINADLPLPDLDGAAAATRFEPGPSVGKPPPVKMGKVTPPTKSVENLTHIVGALVYQPPKPRVQMGRIAPRRQYPF